MAISLNHRAVSALLKLDLSGKSHSKKIEAWAETLGFDSGAALMAAARDDAPAPSAAKEQAPVVPDELPGPAVPAHVCSDDRLVELVVDARSWLMSLTPDEFGELARESFGFGYASDGLYHFLSSKGDGVKKLDDYLSLDPITVTGDQVGFSVDVEGAPAALWMATHRPDTHDALRELIEDGFVDEIPLPESSDALGM